MKVSLRHEGNMKITGTNKLGLKTNFDSHPTVGGEDTAPTPMEVMLQAMGACSVMDIVSILKKKHRQIDNLDIQIAGDQATDFPKVFIKVHLIYELTSPDAELPDLQRSIELSQSKYCSASAMFQRSGCEVTWDAVIKRPEEIIEEEKADSIENI